MFNRPRDVRRIRLQRSELAVPATSEHFFDKAARGNADVIFLDLEDGVTFEMKERARANAIAVLNDMQWPGKTMAVRVNGLDTQWGYRDIVEIAERCPRLDMILLPKTNIAADVYVVETLLAGIEQSIGRRNPIAIECLIETAAGMANIHEIALASERLEAMIFGVGDYTLSVGARDPLSGGANAKYAVLTAPDGGGRRERHWNDPWHYAISRLVATCRAYGLRPIDGPFGDIRDLDAYRASAERGAALGCEGKWAIHPAQVDIANDVFSPTADEIAWSHRIKQAMDQAQGNGAIQLDGRVVDMAHIKKADAILARQSQIDGKATE
jgi:malyl-CoA/(S)-citramalyl-CoA lyase